MTETNDPLLKYLSAPNNRTPQLNSYEDDSEGNKIRCRKYLLALPTVTEGGRNNATFDAALMLKMYGLSSETNLELMLDIFSTKCVPELSTEEITIVVNSAYSTNVNPQGCENMKQFIENIPGVIYNNEMEKEEYKRSQWTFIKNKPENGYAPTLGNAMANFFSKDYINNGEHDNPLYRLIRFNQFSNTVEFAKPAPWHKKDNPVKYWGDSDTVLCRAWSTTNKHVDISKNTMEDAVVAVAQFYSYHPVRQWLESLVWDKKPRLDKMLGHYAGATDSPYVREVGKNTIIAAVARIMDPGCQHDSMLVLEGDPGSGKTSMCRILGGEWYADIPIDPHDKDTVQNMMGSWILEASELEFAKRYEIQAIKRFLTLTVDKIRLSFGRHTSVLPRQTIFIGTVNPGKNPTYLSDTDGTKRRYWPVFTRTIKLKELKADRNQLFAEAFARYSIGEDWHITNKEIMELANQEATKRVGLDSWTSTIEKYLRKGRLPEFLTCEIIGHQALNINIRDYDKTKASRISRIMENIGYERKRRWDNKLKVQHWVWVSEQSDTEDLEGL